MLEKWKSAVDKGKSFDALLADLSKAFNFLSHESFACKIACFGVQPFYIKINTQLFEKQK